MEERPGRWGAGGYFGVCGCQILLKMESTYDDDESLVSFFFSGIKLDKRLMNGTHNSRLCVRRV